MKVRTGFVSNSSSSSFIVKLNKSPDSIKREIICPCCGSKYNHHFNTIFNYIDNLCGYGEDENTTNILKEPFVLEYYKNREDLGRIFIIEVDKNNFERRDAIYDEIENGNIELLEEIPG